MTYYDSLETRSPVEREAWLMARLPQQLELPGGSRRTGASGLLAWRSTASIRAQHWRRCR
jgi:hypothetical protein